MESIESRRREIERFGKCLSLARKPSELQQAKLALGSTTYGVRAMASFRIDDPYCNIPMFPTSRFIIKDYVVPYLYEENVYLIQNDRILRLGQIVDHSITFDSNLATYVDKIVKTKSLNGLPPEIADVFDELLKQGFNFDTMLYWLENIKQILPTAINIREQGAISPLSFWKYLNKEFRLNAVSLILFRDVDSQYYKKTGALRFRISYIKAVRESVGFCFKFYGSEDGYETITKLILPMQRAIIILLLVMFKVQFASNEGPRKKIRKFLDIMQDEMVYLDRETIIAHRYFKNRNSVSFLEVVNPGSRQRDLLKKINNLAWDMTWPRYAEWFIASSEQGDYLILFFLSLDRRLRELLGFYKVKAAIIDKERKVLIPIPKLNTNDYFKQERFNEFTDYFSEEKKQERKLTQKRGLEELDSRILVHYRELRKVLGWRK